jgi:hypothetical protein
MADETIETLQQKLRIYQQLFEKLAPSAPLNILTPQNTNTSTPLTLDSLTPSPPSDSAAPAAPTAPIFKPNKRYIKVEEILTLTGLKKNEYNNLLVRRKLIFKHFLLFINVIFY